MQQMILSTSRNEPEVDWQDLADLIERAGLNHRDPAMLKRVYQHSQFVWFGYVEGRLMATAHAISDLTSVSYLSDVIVDAAWQGQGYGGQLMEAVMEALAPCGKVFIYSMPDKIGFYQKLGYASLTTGMVYAEEQALLRLQEKGFVTK